MTKKLEELLNLDDGEEAPEESKHEEVRDIDQQLAAVNQIASSLPRIKELEQLEDKDLDDLANKAELAYDELMDLGMNVEVRYAGRIFEVAGNFLKTAVDAKTNKVEKKLKAVDLQLKKLKIETDARGKGNQDGDMINGEGFVITDRNELMKKLGKKD